MLKVQDKDFLETLSRNVISRLLERDDISIRYAIENSEKTIDISLEICKRDSYNDLSEFAVNPTERGEL